MRRFARLLCWMLLGIAGCDPGEEQLIVDFADRGADAEAHETDQAPRAIPERCGPEDDDGDGNVDEHAFEELICNGQDDDCDGTVDEGRLADGQELCDGVDNDCDAKTDEDVTTHPNGPQEEHCDTGELGVCATGHVVCVLTEEGYTHQCRRNISEELLWLNMGRDPCNGIDEDCDGVIDEDRGDLPAACRLDFEVIICGEAVQLGMPVCVDGNVICVPRPARADIEEPNGLDDDCDALIDEEDDCDERDNDGDGAVDEELCDHIDNDCDGVVDNPWQEHLNQSCTSQSADPTCSYVGRIACAQNGQTLLCEPIGEQPICE